MKNNTAMTIIASLTLAVVFFAGGFYAGRSNRGVRLTMQYSYDVAEAVAEAESGGISDTEESVSERININTADIHALETLPGIGEVLAQRIVDYRSANGPFQRIEEIQNVEGIGESKFAEMKELIVIG